MDFETIKRAQQYIKNLQMVLIRLAMSK